MKASRKRPAPPQKRPRPAAVSSTRQTHWPDTLAYLLLGAVALLVVAVRLRLMGTPLERDEGEYALMGQLVLRGIPPYEMAYNMKLPGTYYAYALMMSLFGQTTEGIRLGLLAVHLISLWLLFSVGKRIGGAQTGAIAAAAYGLLCLVPNTLALMAHATHFNVVFALAGWWLLLRYEESQRWILLVNSGLCFGLAFVSKQQAVFFPIFGALSLAWWSWKQSSRDAKALVGRLLVFGAAAVLPYALVLLSAIVNGTFERFWHWTVEYASQYASVKTFERAWNNLSTSFTHITKEALSLWLFGFLGGTSALWVAPSLRPWRVPVLLFTVLSVLCVVPGFYFRAHYFIAFFPALALLSGLAVRGWGEWLRARGGGALSWLPLGLFAAMGAYTVYHHRVLLFSDSPEYVCYRLYGRSNPFVESVEIAKFLKRRAKPADRLAIIGPEPQIYFYSGLLPATGFIYTYPLMENQPYSDAMQQEMAAEIERARPRFLVFVTSPMSWLRKDESSTYIFDWFDTYRRRGYRQVLMAELPTGERTQYRDEQALEGYAPQHPNRIMVYERPENVR